MRQKKPKNCMLNTEPNTKSDQYLKYKSENIWSLDILVYKVGRLTS